MTEEGWMGRRTLRKGCSTCTDGREERVRRRRTWLVRKGKKEEDENILWKEGKRGQGKNISGGCGVGVEG